jgi:thiol:disulfide interchange protein
VKRTGIIVLVVALFALAVYFLAREKQPGSVPAPQTTTAPVKPAPRPPVVPIPKNHIYSETANPEADIAAALKTAKREHKRVILDFGGDWCGDCQVLYYYFHKSPNVEVLEKNFVMVPIWIGHMDMNLDLAARYGVPVKHGVPALAVLDGNGHVLYAQSQGEFRDMRHMDEHFATEFLNKWKP